MQQHYGLDVEDIWGMSWRRFVVLFRGIFTFNDDMLPKATEGPESSKYERAVREARGAKGDILHSIDWDAALGREPAAKREIITTEELTKNLGRHQV